MHFWNKNYFQKTYCIMFLEWRSSRFCSGGKARVKLGEFLNIEEARHHSKIIRNDLFHLLRDRPYITWRGVKASRGGGGSQIFSNPRRVILTFLNSEFWIFPMNLVALAEEFQNQIFFIAQGTYPEFWVDFLSYIDTCIAEMTLNLCNNFSLLSRRAQRQSRRL